MFNTRQSHSEEILVSVKWPPAEALITIGFYKLHMGPTFDPLRRLKRPHVKKKNAFGQDSKVLS